MSAPQIQCCVTNTLTSHRRTGLGKHRAQAMAPERFAYVVHRSWRPFPNIHTEDSRLSFRGWHSRKIPVDDSETFPGFLRIDPTTYKVMETRRTSGVRPIDPASRMNAEAREGIRRFMKRVMRTPYWKGWKYTMFLEPDPERPQSFVTPQLHKTWHLRSNDQSAGIVIFERDPQKEVLTRIEKLVFFLSLFDKPERFELRQQTICMPLGCTC